MATETVRALLEGLIDYAGLFPPAQLDMPEAVEEYGRCHRSEDAWILGRFVTPLRRIDELSKASRGFVSTGRPRRPWTISVLVEDDFGTARGWIDAFNRFHGGHVVIESVELEAFDAEEIARAARAFEGLEIFYELSRNKDPGPLMAAVATLGGRGKIRTGGVTAESFPPTAELLRFLHAASRAGIPFKATAGLHHPLGGSYRLTYKRGSASGIMYGFLNVFLAAAWIHDESLNHEELEALISEKSAKAFSFSDQEVVWRGHRLSRDALIAARRGFAFSFGSCSFSEPLRELRALKLL